MDLIKSILLSFLIGGVKIFFAHFQKKAPDIQDTINDQVVAFWARGCGPLF